MNPPGPRRRQFTPRQEQAREVGGRFLGRPPIAMAHRGGATYVPNLGHENTLRAFGTAVAMGYEYIETDLRASRDGEVFCFHDPDLTRMAGRPESFADLTSAQVRQVRLVGGEPIPSLAEALRAFPQTNFNLDIKTEEAVEPAVTVLDQIDAYHRVLLASFDRRRLHRVRRRRPQAATSTSRLETAAVRFGCGPVRRMGARSGALCLQAPTTYRGWRILTPGAIAAAHEQNMQVHAWTIDDPDLIHELLDMGVDGIITDRIDVLKDVLIERAQWPDEAGFFQAD